MSLLAAETKAALVPLASREDLPKPQSSDEVHFPAIANVTSFPLNYIPPFTYPIPDSNGLIIKGEPEGLDAKAMKVESVKSLIDKSVIGAQGYINRGKYSVPASGYLQRGFGLKIEAEKAAGVDFTFTQLLLVLPAIKAKLYLIEYEECTVVVSRKGMIRERVVEVELGYINIQYLNSADRAISVAM